MERDFQRKWTCPVSGCCWDGTTVKKGKIWLFAGAGCILIAILSVYVLRDHTCIVTKTHVIVPDRREAVRIYEAHVEGEWPEDDVEVVLHDLFPVHPGDVLLVVSRDREYKGLVKVRAVQCEEGSPEGDFWTVAAFLRNK